MQKLLLIPSAIFPYSVCLCLGYGFVSGHFRDQVMTVLMNSCLVCAVLAVLCNILFMFFSRNQSACSLRKTALLLKIVHIPSYVLIFALGFLMGLMLFMTFPFIIILVILDCITLFISSMISVFALIKKMNSDAAVSVLVIVCQFIFCADVISLYVLNRLEDKQYHSSHAEAR